MKFPNFKKIGIITKSTIVDHEDCLKKLLRFLKKNKKEALLDKYAHKVIKNSTSYLKSDLINESDVIIALGGDGTLLKVARQMTRKIVPVISINFGTKGFLTELDPKKMIEGLTKIFKGEHESDRRNLLRVTIYRKGEKISSHLGLNEAVVNQGAIARLIDLKIEVDQRKMLAFKADGVIISTPTGSTGHSLSAGGPIVHPQVGGMLVTPICPESLSIRPIIIPTNRELSLTVQTKRRDESANIGLTIDGQKCVALQYGDEIKIRKSKRSLYLIRINNRAYYRTLRKKLHWGTE